MFEFNVHESITKAETLPASFYRDDNVFEALKKQVFRNSWQWKGCSHELFPMDDYVQPMSFLDDFIEEPVFLKKNNDNNEINCFSNVCTHRGNLIFHHECRSKRIACGYHGRQWKKDGGLKFMPEFNDVEDFPRACDHLKKYPTAKLGPHVFTSLNPAFSIDAVFDKMNERILRTNLINNVHLVRFKPGNIVFQPGENLPREFVQELTRFLNDATSRRWVITVSLDEKGAETYQQREDAIEVERFEAVTETPFVQSVLEVFPGAEIDAVRDIGDRLDPIDMVEPENKDNT